MEHILDGYAQENGLRDVDTYIKLVMGLGAILICVCSPSPVTPVFIACSLSAVIILCARIPARLFLTILTIPISFSVLSALIILLTSGGGETLAVITWGPLNLGITTGAANLALLVLVRTFGGMCALYFIALTTPMIELFSVMHACRVPRSFIDLAMLMYHFIFVFIGEAIAIHNAQIIRHGYSTFRNSLNSFALLASMLFVRAWQAGDGLMVAMDSRCYDGKIGLLNDKKPIHAATVILVIIYLCSCAALAVFTATIRIF